MSNIHDAWHRLNIFANSKGDYVGPLREAYADADPTAPRNYDTAQAQFKADIRTVLDALREVMQ